MPMAVGRRRRRWRLYRQRLFHWRSTEATKPGKGSAQGCHPGCFRKRVRKVLKTKGDARKKERKERQRVRKSLCAKELAGLKAEGVERRGQEERGTLAFDERPFAKGALGTLVGRPQDDTLIVLAGRGRLGPMDLRDTAMLPRSLQCAARRTKTVRRKKLGRFGRDDGKRIYFLRLPSA